MSDLKRSVLNKIANAIRAYHGSPHDFDKFDIKKIGTGEGAQAYGHGLYFAENPAVARGYRNQLAKGFAGTDGAPLPHAMQQALEFVHPKFKETEDMRAGLEDAIRRMADQSEFYRKTYGDGWNIYDGALEKLRAVDPATIKPAGRLYTVDLHVPQERLLDWDAPLAQQPHILDALPRSRKNAVREYLSGGNLAPEKLGPRQSYGVDIDPFSGRDLYRALSYAASGRPNDPGISRSLNSVGIPGIRYLDGGSRRAKEGSRNYVMFDDAPIDIVERKAEGGRVGMLTQIANKIANKIRAYHGSPHDFDKFSLDKMGSGEGAQAYGQGLYFAERPEVAQWYKDTLADPKPYQTFRGLNIRTNAQLPYEVETIKKVIDNIASEGYDIGKLRVDEIGGHLDYEMDRERKQLRNLIDSLVHQEEHIKNFWNPELKNVLSDEDHLNFEYQKKLKKDLEHQLEDQRFRIQDYDNAKKFFDENKADFHFGVKDPGRFYTVDIDASPSTDIMDQGKSLRYQPVVARKMKDFITGYAPDHHLGREISDYVDRDLTRNRMVGGFESDLPENNAEAIIGALDELIWSHPRKPNDMRYFSDAMRDVNLVGSSYLDRMSRFGRNRDDDTRNFVVWDDNAVNIVDKKKLGGRV